MDAQLKRGLLEACVLAVLNRDDSYGYKIIKDMPKILEISESTLYPVLKRLEANKFLSVYSVEHNGRLRKFYRITDEGRHQIDVFLDNWEGVMNVYKFIEEGRQQ